MHLNVYTYLNQKIKHILIYFSPDMQLPKSIVFASQKTDGAEFVIPFDYSTSGIYDFNLPIYQKLFKQ